MFRNNTNIIGFLQRKQFFNRTPSPSPSPNSRFNTNPQNTQNTPKNVTPPKNNKLSNSKSNFKTVPVNRNIFDLGNQNSFKGDAEYVNFSQKSFELSSPRVQAGQTGRSFESSRVQVKMCIEQLSSRVSAQLRQLQGAITELTVSLQSIFYRKLGELRVELSRSIDEVFAQAKNNLNNLVSSSNQKHLKKLLKCRHQLTDADKKIKEFKITLDNNWRNAAAQMFASNIDQKIEHLLEESLQTRKSADLNKVVAGVPLQQTAVWQGISKSVSVLIQKRCR